MRRFSRSLAKNAIVGLSSLALMMSFGSSIVYAGNGVDDCVWKVEENSKSYWYEGGVRQGTYSDPQGVLGDDGVIRGREIFDPQSDKWYWLDSVYNGAKAVNKEVWMPYIFQGETSWSEEEILSNASRSGQMANQVADAIRNNGNAASGKWGKWVRYDANGGMIKGWYKVQGDDCSYYPGQVGNVYYYDTITGLMAKGSVTIDGVSYHFNETTGVLDSGNEPNVFGDSSNNGNGGNSDNNGNNGNNGNGNNGGGSISGCTVGSVVTFGSYEQDNNTSNGTEAIEWQVLAVNDNKALLLSKYVLDCQPYNADLISEVYWETSSVRAWLNQSFYNTAFNSTQQSTIVSSNISTQGTSTGVMFGGASGGNDTVDKVFLLALEELKTYCNCNRWVAAEKGGYYQSLMGTPTSYARSRGLGSGSISRSLYDSKYSRYGYSSDCTSASSSEWWLRSPGTCQYYASYVGTDGYAAEANSNYINYYKGIRPAIWVNIQ